MMFGRKPSSVVVVVVDVVVVDVEAHPAGGLVVPGFGALRAIAVFPDASSFRGRRLAPPARPPTLVRVDLAVIVVGRAARRREEPEPRSRLLRLSRRAFTRAAALSPQPPPGELDLPRLEQGPEEPAGPGGRVVPSVAVRSRPGIVPRGRPGLLVEKIRATRIVV
jgi:hypothetical protein